MKKGQAMIEAVLAVLFIAFIFLVFFHLSRMLTARVLVEHAAARAARAKCVGFNDFMCLKAARVALIPIAGERLAPEVDKSDWNNPDFDTDGAFRQNLGMEEGRIPVYLCAKTEALARRLLNYEYWDERYTTIKVSSDHGLEPTATAKITMKTPRWYRPDGHEWDDPVKVEGGAEVESHYPFYMDEGW